MRLFGALIGLSYSSAAFAQSAAPGAGAAPTWMNLVPFVAMFAIMYVLMIRPQMKKQKDHQAYLSKLSRGDEVITSGGILGRIEGMTDLYLTLEIAHGVRIKVLRTAVAGSAKTATAQSEAKA